MSEIVIAPAPILSEAMPLIEDFRDPDLPFEIADLTLACYTNPNLVGLAANQIGLRRRMFCMDVMGLREVCFNPQIIRTANRSEKAPEGCGSIPGKQYLVERPVAVVARWQDKNGKNKARQFDGMIARVFLHEFDHLNGILISDIGEEIHADV